MKSPKRSYLAGWIWLVYLVLFGIAIPWYWQFPGFDKIADAIWLGFPAWVVVAVLGSASISTFTAWLWLKYWPEDEEDES